MRATITRYLEALKRRRTGDEGFSLIELIVVVAILGILVAIAIPVFGNIQESARKNSIETIAASGATQVASQLASATGTPPNAAALVTGLDAAFPDATFAVTPTTPTIDGYCVTAVGKNDLAGWSAASGNTASCTKAAFATPAT